MKILICDDKPGDGEVTLQSVTEGTRGRHQVDLWSGKKLLEQVGLLFQHAEAFLGPRRTDPPDEPVFGGDFDIAILDNNLSGLRVGCARHTAESIAGYVRAFSRIPYIVSLNKNTEVDFDLRHLVGDHHTHADIALNTEHLGNRALWSGEPEDAKDRFLPWYWPTLNEVPNRRRRQIDFVTDHLDKPVLGALGFPKSATDHLSLHAQASLCPEAQSVRAVTFKRFFLSSCRSLPILRERRKLARSTASNDTGRDIVARVVAGELDRWVRRDLLGPQDVLVDLPHLLMRMPFLLGERASRLACWNNVLTEPGPPFGLRQDLYDKHLQDARLPDPFWAKSPCFFWRTLKADVELNRLFRQDRTHWASAAFCEDRSQFVTPETGRDEPKEFHTEFEGAWPWRYVAPVGGKDYVPISRLAR